jgi:hypothetical protein
MLRAGHLKVFMVRIMNYVILLTACVDPNGMKYTKLQNSEQRKKQYIEALDWYINNTNFNIIFAENSNCDFSDMYKKYIEENRLEYLTYSGNDYDKSLGKGFGEANIIKYAINNSKLIRDDDYIIKITGRIKVLNINKLIDVKDKAIQYKNNGNKFAEGTIVSFPVKFIKKYFNKNINLINDSKSFYFEHALYKSINEQKEFIKREFKINPKIDGFRGTTGKKYSNQWYNFLLWIKEKMNIFVNE